MNLEEETEEKPEGGSEGNRVMEEELGIGDRSGKRRSELKSWFGGTAQDSFAKSYLLTLDLGLVLTFNLGLTGRRDSLDLLCWGEQSWAGWIPC